MADASGGADSNTVPWWRFSVKQLLLLTALVGLGCVALRSASATWVAAMFGLAQLALAASLLLAMYREGGSRAFWVGFALFGGLHLVYPTVIGLQPMQVVTTRISHHIYDWLYSEPSIPPGAPGWGVGPASGMSTPGGPDMYSSGAGGYPGPMSGSDGSMGYGSAGGMPGATGMGGMMGGGGGAAIRPFTGPTLDNFTSVAHTLWMLLLGLCGGWLAQWLHATRRRSSDRQESLTSMDDGRCRDQSR